MRHTFITIVLILLATAMLASCDSTRRAARQFNDLVERHPELLRDDTIKIDTLLYIAPDSDTVVFDIENILETDSCVVMDAAHGTFTVEKLPSRQFRVIYTPDTTTVRFRENVTFQKVVIEQPLPWWKTVLRLMVFLFILLLLPVFFMNEIRKLFRK